MKKEVKMVMKVVYWVLLVILLAFLPGKGYS